MACSENQAASHIPANPRDATRFIGRRTYDENKVSEEADDDAEQEDEEDESWMERIAGT